MLGNIICNFKNDKSFLIKSIQTTKQSHCYLGLAILLLPSVCLAVTAVDNAGTADFTPHTTKFIGHIKSNLVPISSIVGVVVGLCRSFMTQSLTPLAICGGAGVGSGMLLDYFHIAFPIVL